jgi:predicted permease
MSLWSRIKNVFQSDRHLEEIREELEFHLAMDEASGRDAREARLRLGNVARIAEETHSAGTVAWLESALQDARYGLRQLRKTPAASLAIILSLGIGLGANTAIFTLADAALLKPLPVNDPDRLVMLEWSSPGGFPWAQRIGAPPRRLEGGQIQMRAVSEAVYREFAARQSAFAAVIGFSRRIPMAISGGTGIAEQVGVQYVSANFFAGLGVSPILGRSFRDDEDRRGEEPAVVLSHRFWISRLGGDRDLLGRSLRVNNVPVRIVGIAPPGFFGTTIGEWVDVYATLSARPAFESGQAARPPPGGENADWWLHFAARLPPEAAGSAAALQETALFRGLAAETTGTEIRPDLALLAEPGRRGVNPIGGGADEARAIWTLMLLVAVLLLIVCVNVANLLLSRSVAQQRESAVRLALGASHRQLFRQHLIGGGIFALVGACAGLGLGYVLARAVHALFQTGQGVGNAYALQSDSRVLAYTFVLAVATTLVFGMAPAIQAARSDVSDSLKVQARSVIGGRLRLPRLLVSLQLALCFAALVAAGLLGRSFENLTSVDLGFDAENLAYATVNPYQAGYAPEQVGPYLDELKRDLEAIPGVLDVAVADNRPLEGGGRGTWISTPDGPPLLEGGGPNPAAYVNLGIGSSELTDTLGVRLLAGRALGPADRPGAPVAVVDERFADVFFAGRNPVGEHFAMLDQTIEVIGLAANARFLDLREEATPTVYVPFDPARFLPGEIHFAIRTASGSNRLAADVRRVVGSLNPAVPLTEFHTQAGLINRALRSERLLALLSGGFGLIALTLAAIGLGGLLAYAVARRTNEIGVRMALGAARADVIRLILRDATRMAGLGALIGLPAAYGVSRFMQASLFELDPVDPLSVALALAALLLVALTAAWLPARRAARVSPVTALREE